MENYGLMVIRFTAHEVGHRLEKIISTIAHVASQHTINNESEKPPLAWRCTKDSAACTTRLRRRSPVLYDTHHINPAWITYIRKGLP